MAFLPVNICKKMAYDFTSSRLRVGNRLRQPEIAIQCGRRGVQNQPAVRAFLQMVLNLSLHAWGEFPF
jgi:hypothetical protein